MLWCGTFSESPGAIPSCFLLSERRRRCECQNPRWSTFYCTSVSQASQWRWFAEQNISMYLQRSQDSRPTFCGKSATLMDPKWCTQAPNHRFIEVHWSSLCNVWNHVESLFQHTVPHFEPHNPGRAHSLIRKAEAPLFFFRSLGGAWTPLTKFWKNIWYVPVCCMYHVYSWLFALTAWVCYVWC